MNILAASLQAQGPRERQEDAVLCEPAEGVFGVFDGLGGKPRGAQNAQGAARLLWEKWRAGGCRRGRAELEQAWREARVALHEEQPQGDTTATALWVVSPQLAVVLHAGDCSLLRWRAGVLEPLTTRHGFGNIVLNTFRMNGAEAAEPDYIGLDLLPGDTLILHSDGLDVLTHDAIAALLTSLAPGTDYAERAASMLVSAALASDTHDNTSAVVIHLHAEKEPHMTDQPKKPTRKPKAPLAEVIAAEPDLAAAQGAIHAAASRATQGSPAESEPEILPPAAQPQPASPPAEQDPAQVTDAHTDAPELEEAASADVEKATQGALVTGPEQWRAEQARRLEEHRALLSQELLGLPLLQPAVVSADLSPCRALEVLQGSVWRSWAGASSQTFKLDFGYLDAEFGSYVGAALTLTYEPSSRHITREALLVWLTALRRERLTSGHAANLIGQTLWSLLQPAKLTVQVKPSRLQESATWKRGDEQGVVYELVEETLRLALALRVPAMIERIRAQGGPDPVDLEDASARAVKLVDKLKTGSYALTGDDGLLSTACHAVAFAAFLKGGIRVLGHHFEAKTHKPAPTSEPVQTDFVDYANAKATGTEPMIPVSAAKRAAENAVKFAFEKHRRDQEAEDDDLTIGEDGKIRVKPATVAEAAAQAWEDKAADLRAKHGDDELALKLADLADAEGARIRQEGQAQFGASKFVRGWDGDDAA